MLNRLITRSSHLRLLATTSSRTNSSTSLTYITHHHPLRTSSAFSPSFILRFFSGNGRNNGGNSNDRPAHLWKLSSENDQNVDAVFEKDTGPIEGISVGEAKPEDDDWLRASAEDTTDDLFKRVDYEEAENKVSGFEEYKPWSLAEEEKEEEDVFGIANKVTEIEVADVDAKSEAERAEEARIFAEEEKELTEVLRGPNRAFGDLIAASGITDAMLDSLTALKDLDGVEGLPPLKDIEDMRYEKNTRKSARAEIERLKQEEVAKAQVREVDEKGRAYGTGRRKCSIARVWIQPGDGKFVVNDKEFDVYFPMLDHRAALLRPFSETKTLGIWDISCTVKGGGVSGQVGAIQLGISRALQNWEPKLRPPLKAVGFLTRDSRVVERKKPGKAKARKSFQWVKR